ncbi:dTMP kinase [Texcoconibacillus texcoconensis]|uniref:Thymidylate kinase n=1 Tax=Texcoconibacillus texcoconensis TaxID=1095777 RepID=A0A840QUG7_9BACI|nr:dTMP kinase [Texcoconibacillus texcoconensis]
MNERFITFEGGEGAGKSTVLERIYEKLVEQGYSVMKTREPGGNEIAEKIRDLILDTRHTDMDPRTEALLYAAARRQHFVQKVKPALEAGTIVLCDRFIDSSLVYQGVARDIGVNDVWQINQFATEGNLPAVTYYFDVSPEVGLGRIEKEKNREVNRLDKESRDFHEKVRNAYLHLQKQEPERIETVDAERSLEDVVQSVWEDLENYLASLCS